MVGRAEFVDEAPRAVGSETGSPAVGKSAPSPACLSCDPARRDNVLVKARLVAFGDLRIEGERYERDVVIDAGRIRRRRKGPSKARRGEFGHTPLTSAEDIPWGGRRLIVGTGADAALPITPDVYDEADRRGIFITALPTRDACRMLAKIDATEVYAVLHVTC